MRFLKRLIAVLMVGMAIFSITGCSVRQHLLQQAADEVSQSSVDEEDIGLARDASAFYLKISESLLAKLPEHIGLAESVTRGFTQYSYAFLAFEADRIESKNLLQAQHLRQRAARMYERAKAQGLRTLLLHQPEIFKPEDSKDQKRLLPLRPDEVGLAYWTAAAWGGQISLSTDAPDVVADLPLVVNLAHKAWVADPSFADGALASLMGTLELSRPGGSRERALQYFDQAIEISKGQAPGPWVAKAEGWALDQQDRASFEACLQKAIEVSSSKRDLSSQIMRARAQWLLSQVDNIF